MKHSKDKKVNKSVDRKVASIEAEERRQNPKQKADCGFGRRGAAITITVFACGAIVIAGMLLVKDLRNSDKYAASGNNAASVISSSSSDAFPVVSSTESGLIYNQPSNVIRTDNGSENIIRTTQSSVIERNEHVETQTADNNKSTSSTSTSSSSNVSVSGGLDDDIFIDVPEIPNRGYTGDMLFG